MTWKVLSLLFVVAGVSSHVAVSEQKVVVHHGHHGELVHVGEGKPEHHQEYAWSYPSYEFSYKVEDPHTHDYKGQHETRHGDEVKGEYWLLQPDGHKRTVKYHTDKKGGFNAKVEFVKVHEELHRPHVVHVEHVHKPAEESKPVVEEPVQVEEEPRIEERQEERREERTEERREEQREERREERREESEERNESEQEREPERQLESEQEREEEPRSPPRGHKKVIEFYEQIHHDHKPHIHLPIRPVIKHKVHPHKPIHLERIPLREYNPKEREEESEERGGEVEGSEERAERAMPMIPARKSHDVREPYYGHRRYYRKNY